MTATIAAPTVPVMLYHSVSDHAAPRYRPWNLSPSLLAAHLDWVLHAGFTPIPLDRLIASITARADLPKRPIVVTFDDGLADFLDGALPVLTARRIPVTLFVTTGFVGHTSEWLAPLGEGRRPMLTWAQLRDVLDAGVSIGSHAHTHRPLDELTPADLTAELTRSRSELEERLGVHVGVLAYPHGYHSEKIKASAREAGYSAACAVRNAISSGEDDVMAMARVMITNPCSVDDLEALLQPGRLPVAPFTEQLRTKAWRGVRRVRSRLRRSLGR
jgi:peptidoglycan/xylan/chitin deacetylase (PgdA/CDA1 family)